MTRQRTPFDHVADWLAVPAHDKPTLTALGLIASGALLILGAAQRITHHA